MLKIAFITDAPRIAGSEIWLAETVPLLKKHGIEPHVFLPQNEKLQPLFLILQKRGVKVVPYRKRADVIQPTQKYDLRLLQAWHPSTYSLLKELPKPNFVFLHDQLEYNYPLGLKNLYRFFFKIAKARGLAFADMVLTGTYWASRYLQRHFGLKSKVAPVGVNPHRFQPPNKAEKHALRQKWGLSKFTLLTPARFTLEKNHLAIILTAKKVPEADFLLVGEGDWSLFIKGIAKILGISNVFFLGRQDAMEELYKAVDAVLFPSLADNPGLVILEGMASGLPVITSHFPPQQEVISDQEGLLIPPIPREISQAIRWLMTHPEEARRMGMRGRERVLKERTTAMGAQRLAEILLEATVESQ